MNSPWFTQMVNHLITAANAPAKPDVTEHYAELDEMIVKLITKGHNTFRELVRVMASVCSPYLEDGADHSGLVDRRLQALRRKNVILVYRKGTQFIWHLK